MMIWMDGLFLFMLPCKRLPVVACHVRQMHTVTYWVINVFSNSLMWDDTQNCLIFIYCKVVLFCYWFIVYLLFPGDGGWGQWSNWTECTKSCGGGVRSRKRECDSPSPEGEGNYCEGLGTEVTACNTDHCPGTFIECVECRWGCEYVWFTDSDSVSLCVCCQWRRARRSQAQCSVAAAPPALAPVMTWLWVSQFPPITTDLTLNHTFCKKMKNSSDDKDISSFPSALWVAMWAGVLLYRGKGPVC